MVEFSPLDQRGWLVQLLTWVADAYRPYGVDACGPRAITPPYPQF